MPHRQSSKKVDVRALRDRLNLMTEDELFALLDIATGTGKNRQSAGTLPPRYKYGRGSYYRVEEVDAWLRRQRIEPSR